MTSLENNNTALASFYEGILKLSDYSVLELIKEILTSDQWLPLDCGDFLKIIEEMDSLIGTTHICPMEKIATTFNSMLSQMEENPNRHIKKILVYLFLSKNADPNMNTLNLLLEAFDGISPDIDYLFWGSGYDSSLNSDNTRLTLLCGCENCYDMPQNESKND